MFFEIDHTRPVAKFSRIFLAIFLAGGFLIGFRHEINLTWLFLVDLLRGFLGIHANLTFTTETLRAFAVVILNGGIAIFGYLLVLYWMSRFVLPITDIHDQKDVYRRIVTYNLPFVGAHGPAVFIKDGKPIADEDELEEADQGIALLDIYSSIVLEQQYGGYENDEDNPIAENNNYSENSVRPLNSVSKFLKKLMIFLVGSGDYDEQGIVRASGPGIALTDYGEKISGWADLRKQFRIRNNVLSNTSDGIEVSTSVFVIFTLGQRPDVIQVAKINDVWSAIKFEDVALNESVINDSRIADKRIKVLADGLTDEDKVEIDTLFGIDHFVWNVGGEDKVTSKVEGEIPFVYNEDRIISAVYSRALDAKAGRRGDWTDLPVDVAVEIFRNMLVHKTFDELYFSKNPDVFPLSELKGKFAGAVKSTGVMNYQVVRRKDGHPMEGGQTCRINDLAFSPPSEFTHSAVLRDRGIKVIAAGFGDLIPTSDTIQKQFFDNWRARWQQEAEKTLADHDLQATRIRNRERAKAQQDMIYSLSQILQSEQYTAEALVMRLYQALETAATQPATQRLLPRDTIRMLWNLRNWLLPDENKNNENMPERLDYEDAPYDYDDEERIGD